MTYTVRLIQPSDYQAVYALYEQIRWDGTKQEWIDLIKYGAKHSSVVIYDEKVIGAALALPFDSKVRIAGVIVDPNHRGKCLGEKISSFLLTQLKEGLYLELDATPSGKRLYEKFQFVEVEPVFSLTKLLNHSSSNAAATLCTETELDQIEALDYSVFGASRRAFIDRAFYQERSPILVSRKNRKITGFILCSAILETEMRLGPWISEKLNDAKYLLDVAMDYSAKLGMKKVSINVLKSHSDALKIIHPFGFQMKEENTRMKLGISPVTKKEFYYALWSLELG